MDLSEGGPCKHKAISVWKPTLGRHSGILESTCVPLRVGQYCPAVRLLPSKFPRPPMPWGRPWLWPQVVHTQARWAGGGLAGWPELAVIPVVTAQEMAVPFSSYETTLPAGSANALPTPLGALPGAAPCLLTKAVMWRSRHSRSQPAASFLVKSRLAASLGVFTHAGHP